MENNTPLQANSGGITSDADLSSTLNLQIQSLVPTLTETERQHIISYYELNKLYSKKFEEEALAEFKQHPVWGPIIAQMSPEMMEQQNSYSQMLQEAAIYENKWETYLDHLVQQGVVYAKMGISFKDWVEVILLARKYFIRMLEAEFKDNTQMILNCTQGMNLMIDIALCAIGESYVMEEKKIVERKKQEYTQLLEIKNTQLIDFCNIVSHNLRAPLANIMMLVDYIEQSDEEEERMEVFSKIRPVISHLSEIFNELVESVQVRQDKEVKMVKLDFEKNLQKVIRGFDAQIKSYDAEIEMDFQAAPFVHYPQKYMDSILTNLLSNSLKYRSLDRRPVIKFKSEQTDKGIVLAVSDNGLGIDLELHRNNLFKIRKVFHEHPDAKGFGLFMVKTQVEAMDGTIWVESTPGAGSTFYVAFKTEKL